MLTGLNEHRQQVPHRLAGALEDAADELEARLQPVGLLRRVGAPGAHLARTHRRGVVEVGPRGVQRAQRLLLDRVAPVDERLAWSVPPLLQ